MNDNYVIYDYKNHDYISNPKQTGVIRHADTSKQAVGYYSRREAENTIETYALHQCKVLSRGEIL